MAGMFIRANKHRMIVAGLERELTEARTLIAGINVKDVGKDGKRKSVSATAAHALAIREYQNSNRMAE